MIGSDNVASIINQFPEKVNQIENLIIEGDCVFLIGAGCSNCAGLPIMSKLTDKVLANEVLLTKSKEVLNEVVTNFETADSKNIEDYLSEIVDFYSILNRRKEKQVDNSIIQIGTKGFSVDDLNSAISDIKKCIVEVIKNAGQPIDNSVYRLFVNAIHRSNRPGKITSQKRTTYLNLNYDTLLEDALAQEKISFFDGIDGGSSGWWNPSKYSNPDVLAKVLKLHGSIDWIQLDDDPLPQRLSGNITLITKVYNSLIWPASTKYIETQLDPFAQLLSLARNALSTDNQSEKVLIAIGYSFSDGHINAEIDRALRSSGGRLALVAFTSSNEPTGQLKVWFEDIQVTNKVLIYANRGFFHGAEVIKSETDLLWWRFENFVKLIRGEY